MQCNAKDIAHFFKERQEARTNAVHMPVAAKRNFSAMKADMAQLEQFEERVGRAVEKAQMKEGALQTDAVINVMSSTAGAGSGDFHMYRGFRAKEMTRQQDMEAERREEAANRAWEEERAEREAEVAAKTAKKSAKRERQKQKQREAREAAKRAKGNRRGGAGEE